MSPGLRRLCFAALLLTGCGAPKPSATSKERPTPRICRTQGELVAAGETVLIPSLKKKHDGRPSSLWRGASLSEAFPEAATFTRCRPCDCGANKSIEPWEDWYEVNVRAYAKLRQAEAPYPIAVVPGFHGGGEVVERRVLVALELLKQGWVGSLMFSGGHRRSGWNEAKFMLGAAKSLAYDIGVDVRDRIFVEPCAVTSLTNLRNSLRMMAALGIPYGLLVTDSKMTGQAMLFYTELEELVRKDLSCSLGRVSYLLGDSPVPRVGDSGSPCQPPLSFRNNPVGFMIPSRRASIFWVSPLGSEETRGQTALSCVGGSQRLLAKEPDDQNPFESACLPPIGKTSFACEAKPKSLEQRVRDRVEEIRDALP